MPVTLTVTIKHTHQLVNHKDLSSLCYILNSEAVNAQSQASTNQMNHDKINLLVKDEIDKDIDNNKVNSSSKGEKRNAENKIEERKKNKEKIKRKKNEKKERRKERELNAFTIHKVTMSISG